jgi:type IV pilus assembly protein PilB
VPSRRHSRPTRPGARSTIAPRKGPLSASAQRELREAAEIFESVIEAGGLDVSTLESLREIYTRLGDSPHLAFTVERLTAALAHPAPAAAAPPAGRAAARAPRPAAGASPASAPDRPAAFTTSRTPRVATRAQTPSERHAEPAQRAFAAAVAVERSQWEAATAVDVVEADVEQAPAPGPDTPAGPPRIRAVAASRRGRLGELLVAEGLISQEQLSEALREHRRSKERLGSVLARKGLVSEERLVELLSREHGLPSVAAADVEVDADVLALVPPHIARKYDVLPLARTETALTLAMADPANVVTLDEITAMTNLQVLPVVAAAAAIRAAHARLYPARRREAAPVSLSDVVADLAAEAASVEDADGEEPASKAEVIELSATADAPPVVKLVNLVLMDAIKAGASDLHWEPYEKVFRVRFRVDGVLHETVQPPKRHEPAIISRLKIMSNLDISERRVPQDGRIKLRFDTREIDLRVSILPTIFGEKAVLRILDKEALKLDLTQLGFDPWSMDKFNAAIHQPYGMVLITGPTGSGKTTTLYSAIHTINSPEHNIMTAEDPVEYNLKGVNQVQVNEGVGRTFAATLRSFLRQDPDVILVGETRDLETAQISIRAALTGHLVFTTLHTNDCPSTVARLFDMGIQPFLLSSSLLLILAQRLGRKICNDCREPYDANEEDLVPYGHMPTGAGAIQLFKGKGCQTCNFTGMKGRVAIYEVMPISERLRALILKNASTAELQEAARREGMKTLREAGLAKVLEGITTVDEVVRVTLS